jgi:hypothetical protein
MKTVLNEGNVTIDKCNKNAGDTKKRATRDLRRILKIMTSANQDKDDNGIFVIVLISNLIHY